MLSSLIVGTVFVKDGMKLFAPDTGSQAVALLVQLAAKRAAAENSVSEPLAAGLETQNLAVLVPAVDIAPPVPLKTAVLVSTLWGTSLVLLITCALWAHMLVNSTTLHFISLQRRSPNKTIEDHALENIRMHVSAEQYGLQKVAPTIVSALLHIAIVLFIIGLIVRVFPVEHVPAFAGTALAVLLATGYTFFRVWLQWIQNRVLRPPQSDLETAYELQEMDAILQDIRYLFEPLSPEDPPQSDLENAYELQDMSDSVPRDVEHLFEPSLPEELDPPAAEPGILGQREADPRMGREQGVHDGLAKRSKFAGMSAKARGKQKASVRVHWQDEHNVITEEPRFVGMSEKARGKQKATNQDEQQ